MKWLLLLLAIACRGEPSDGERAAAPEQFALGTLPPTAVPPVVPEVSDGLAGPETVVVDYDQDVYFVSNIHGDPEADDHDGYISKISPSGEMLQRYFIDGRVPGVDLSAPRGMVIGGDTLYVADIHAIRLFDRKTGLPGAVWPVPDAQFLDHLAIGANGHVLATDIGIALTPTGAVKTGPYTIYDYDAGGHGRVLARGDDLHGPTGIATGPDGAIVCDFMGDEHGVYRLDDNGGKKLIGTLPFGQLDGIALAPDGSILVSSWLGHGVYRLVPGQPAIAVVEHLSAPAAIAYDAIRGRILIPELTENKLRAETWSPPSARLLPADMR